MGSMSCASNGVCIFSSFTANVWLGFVGGKVGGDNNRQGNMLTAVCFVARIKLRLSQLWLSLLLLHPFNEGYAWEEYPLS